MCCGIYKFLKCACWRLHGSYFDARQHRPLQGSTLQHPVINTMGGPSNTAALRLLVHLQLAAELAGLPTYQQTSQPVHHRVVRSQRRCIHSHRKLSRCRTTPSWPLGLRPGYIVGFIEVLL